MIEELHIKKGAVHGRYGMKIDGWTDNAAAKMGMALMVYTANNMKRE